MKEIIKECDGHSLYYFFLLRRVLDSNQWIPYDIGSLANCWFQPLTQLSVAVTLKKVCKYSAFLQQCKIILIKLEELSKNYLRKVKYLPARKLYTAQIAVVIIFDGVAHMCHDSTKNFIQA